MTNRMTEQYVVIGHPIAHSRSPQIHARFAHQTGQDISYERLLAPLDGFEAAVRSFVASGGQGANVTVPFKLAAFALADERSARAQAAGAVNTLTFNDGRILGDNTDGVGLVRDLSVNAGVALAGARVLLLGAGGAARGAILALLEQQPDRIVIANRTLAKAEALVVQFSAAGGALSAARFDELSGRFDLVVNATSASLSSALPPVPSSVFSAQTFAYDMMYGQAPTVFMQMAAAHGARVRDGLGMLVEQAAESFFVWRGVRPDTAPVYQWLREQL